MLLTGPFGSAERTIQLNRPMTIAEIIAANDLQFRLPTIAVMAGEPVLRGTWAVRVVRPEDVLAFVAVPRGGGEGGNKQIIGLVAALALSVAAPMIGGWVAGTFFAGSAMAASIASAAILVGGSMLLNALMPPPTQAPGSKADTVYSATAANNQAAPLDVVPVLYGEVEFAPRYAARPYSEFRGNDQFLYQLFTVTAGKAEVKHVKIGETEAWSAGSGYSSSFSDIEFEIIQPGDDIKLFPANVVTSAEVSGQQVPNPSDKLGPFVVNAAGTTVDRLAVDFVFPGGLWKANKKGVASNSIKLRAQYRRIDDDGDPIGGWSDIFAETIKASTRTPQRMSRDEKVPDGRYEVQFLADEDFDDDDGQAVNRVAWTGLRGYLTGFVTPPNTTLLAMKIRANEQLSQLSSSQIRVLARRHLPVWTGGNWVTQQTRSIAWATADLLRNADYSLGLSDGQYDLAALAQLATTWSARGDTFNAVFDRSWTVADALRAVLRAGRAQPVRIAGKIGFVRLQPRSIKRATFTARNVVRGSFQHKLVLFDEEKPDSVLGAFVDRTVWQNREVLAGLSSIGSEAPQKIDWFGITDKAQAWRESVTEAAVNAYQREFVSFTADWEGKLLVRGDPILVQHPFIEGVQSAALVAQAGDVLTIDRDLDQPIEDTAYVILRGKDGREWGPCRVTSINGRALTLSAADRAAVVSSMGSLASILPDARSERAHVLICDGETRPFNGLVVSAVPDAAGKVSILSVIDAPEVYLADQTETEPPTYLPPALPPVVPLRPLIAGLYAALRSGLGGLELDAMWQPSPGATLGYVAEVSYDEQLTWTPVYAGDANRFTAAVLPQPLVLRVAAVGRLQGAWVYRTFDTADMPPGGAYIDVGSINEEFQQLTGVLDGEGSLSEQVGRLLEALDDLAEATLKTGVTGEMSRRELIAEQEGNRAYFVEQVSAVVSATEAAVNLTTLLLAEFGGNTATAVSQITTAATEFEAVSTLTQEVAADLNGVTANGLFKMEAIAKPSGVSVRLAILARRSTAVDYVETGIIIDLFADGTSRIGMKADSLYLLNSSNGVVKSPFSVVGGVVYLTDTRIDGNLMLLGSLITDRLEEHAVTDYVITSPGGRQEDGGEVRRAKIEVDNNADVHVRCSGYQYRPDQSSGNYGYYQLRLKRDGDIIAESPYFYDDNFSQPFTIEAVDRPGNGEHTYSCDYDVTSGSGRVDLGKAVMVLIENKR